MNAAYRHGVFSTAVTFLSPQQQKPLNSESLIILSRLINRTIVPLCWRVILLKQHSHSSASFDSPWPRTALLTLTSALKQKPRTPVSASAGATFPHFWNIVNKITAQRIKVSRIYERGVFVTIVIIFLSVALLW